MTLKINIFDEDRLCNMVFKKLLNTEHQWIPTNATMSKNSDFYHNSCRVNTMFHVLSYLTFFLFCDRTFAFQYA